MATKTPAFADGKICYVEIPTINMTSSILFYYTIFGWIISKLKNGTVVFTDSANEISGVFIPVKKVSHGSKLLIYIMVNKIDITLQKINLMGGKIILPLTKINGTKTGKFKDPSGNVFGLHQYSAKKE